MSCSCKLFAAHLLFDVITEQIIDDDDDDDEVVSKFSYDVGQLQLVTQVAHVIKIEYTSCKLRPIRMVLWQTARLAASLLQDRPCGTLFKYCYV